MTSEERKLAISNFLKNADKTMTGITITYNGERKQFDAYLIPLNLLTYNPYNGRIGAEVKSFERQNHVLNPNDENDVRVIEDFLWKSKIDANEKTMASLLKDHQEKYGIVTADGMIIDGNRRACLLNRLYHNETIPLNQKVHTQYFLGVILPADATKKEILRLETTYQMGEDAKVDYGPVEKYLKARDLKDLEFTNQDIADFMGVSKKEVETYLRVMKLMDEYLNANGYNGIYTMLDTNEDSFLKLDIALRSYESGGASRMWGYDVEADVADLKTIAFDYMRLGLDQDSFRNIVRQPNRNNGDTSFFSNERIWKSFSKTHFQITQNVQEDSVDHLRKLYPTTDLKKILTGRDNDWRRRVSKDMMDNLAKSNDELNNTQQANEPFKLLEKARLALLSVDGSQSNFNYCPEIADCLDKIIEVANKLRRDLGK